MARLVACLLAVVLVPTPTSPAPRLKEPPRPPVYYPTQVGAEWVYRQGDREWAETITDSIRQGGTTVVTIAELGPNGELVPAERIAVSERGLFWVEGIQTRLTPDVPSCLLDLTLPPGGTWTPAGDSSRHTVRRPERVDVPAGRFEAVPVEVEVAYRDGPATDTYWYAPGVGLVKAVYGRGPGPRVLKSFTPGKK
jgi:hypothetical protein